MSSRETFDAAFALLAQAAEEARLENAQSAVRVAKLRTAKALTEAGREEEAAAMVAEVRAEQDEGH